MIVRESLLKFPPTEFSTKLLAPIPTKNPTSSFTSLLPSLAVSRGSAREESSSPPQSSLVTAAGCPHPSPLPFPGGSIPLEIPSLTPTAFCLVISCWFSLF